MNAETPSSGEMKKIPLYKAASAVARIVELADARGAETYNDNEEKDVELNEG